MSNLTKIFFNDEERNNVKISKFTGHFRPQSDTKYFANQRDQHIYGNTLSVIFPFFNEEGTDLERSLESIAEQSRVCNEYKSYNVRIVCIMDGWNNASESMKTYLKMLFPQDVGVKWWNEIEQCVKTTNDINTFIVERQNPTCDYLPVELFSGEVINLSLIVKGDNRRKANSHEWFFSAFAKEMKSTYVFATDCGALYEKDCLVELLKYLESHSDVSGVTGRQRVMSPEMQGCTDEGVMEMVYRSIQAYDYETSISSYQGAFSFIGMLPVLPGPCGLYRMSDISGECLDYYFDTLEKGDSGMLFGNLLLAEDRVLSYAAALKTGKYTRWVPRSIFYFEAETDVRNFITQRRRWTNGAFAGYMYLLFSEQGIIKKSTHSGLFKKGVWSLLAMQLLMFVFTMISPALFMGMTANTIKNLKMFGDKTDYVAYISLIINCASYLIFNVTHYNVKFSRPVFNLTLLTNTVSMLWILLGIIIGMLQGDIIICGIVAMVILTPIILSIIHDLKVTMLILTNLVPYLLMVPTFVFTFPNYAYMRTWDLSWGNRPSGDNGLEKNTKRMGLAIALIITIVNLAGAICLSSIIDINIFIYSSIILLIPSFLQQVFSLLYYLCYTKTLFSRVWENRGKSKFDIVGQFASLCSLFLNVFSISSGKWLTRNDVIKHPTTNVWISDIKIDYGPLVRCFTVEKINNTSGAEYKGCDIWGTNVVNDWPSQAWSVSIVSLILSVIFSGIVVGSTLTSMCINDKSRMINNNNIYAILSAIMSISAILAFPMGFGDDYFINWFYPTTICNGGGMYDIGDCDMGYGFMTAIAGSTLSVISGVCMYFGIRTRRGRKKIVRPEVLDTDVKFKRKYRSYMLSRSNNNSPEISLNS